MNMLPASRFQSCAICGCTRDEIARVHKGRANGPFYLNKFCRHLAESHGIALQYYCEFHLGVPWPRCPVTGIAVGYKADGKGLHLSTYKRGVGITKAMSPAFRAACERQSVARCGPGNPMFGRPAWNRGLPRNHPYRAAMATRRRGVVEAESTRIKHRRNRASHPLKARHTTPHTPMTKEKIAQHTARMFGSGAFRRESSAHRNMRGVLDSLGAVYEEEYCIGRYSGDFAFPEKRVVLEVDGDFFHTNPQLYPEGPKCWTQRRNAANDRKKNAYLRKAGWTVLRRWESDINSGGFAARLKADLVQLSILRE